MVCHGFHVCMRGLAGTHVKACHDGVGKGLLVYALLESKEVIDIAVFEFLERCVDILHQRGIEGGTVLIFITVIFHHRALGAHLDTEDIKQVLVGKSLALELLNHGIQGLLGDLLGFTIYKYRRKIHNLFSKRVEILLGMLGYDARIGFYLIDECLKV